LFAFSQPSWAEPAPSQIQAEMAAGQWRQAHDDLITVLRDHPNSQKAQSLLATVDTHLARQPNTPFNPAPSQGGHSRLIPIVLLVVGIWVVFRIMRARQRRAMGGMYGAPGGQGFGAGSNPYNPNMGPPGYNPNMYPPQQPPAAGGGMLGGLAGGLLGGVIAENLLGNRNQPVDETIINENGNNAGNDGWDNNSNGGSNGGWDNGGTDWSQQADNGNDDNDSWT
jgi:hypothetical protein